jgi:hypothetical protein
MKFEGAPYNELNHSTKRLQDFDWTASMKKKRFLYGEFLQPLQTTNEDGQ